MQRSLSAISSPHLGDVGMHAGLMSGYKSWKTMGKVWKKLGKVWKTWKNYGKTMGQVWNNNGTLIHGDVYGKKWRNYGNMI